ncbi:hypothetical protein PanWU01x14_181860 [Parasponia andersonii]|uniref:Uncharacterized protein n=1 Tax=Parasponia andersonii TaxID=3476 RepID=A0A2P5C5Q4_PARAD|nr:hypothetical protein PanWU01x14_181860 [Parasponia andersonii]
MEEAAPKCRPSPETSGDITGKFTGLVAEQDGAVEISPEIPIREELIEEVMQELYREITNNNKRNSASDHGGGPGSSGAETASFGGDDAMVGGYMGKSESCGACVSESASTVMAGIELVGSTFTRKGFSFPFEKTTMWGESSGGGGYRWDDHDHDHDQVEKWGEGMDGCDGGGDDHHGVDDEWLARVLSWGPLELEYPCF